MKCLLTVLMIVMTITSGFCQMEDLPENTGDNFSLEGALTVFKKSKSLEAFEKSLNEENASVNNLDLNNDGDVDYILVNDIQEGETHAIVLSTYLNETEKQDIAVIGIEKTGNENAILQIEGDSELYAENTFVEPVEVVETTSGGKGGPDMPEIATNRVVVNVWFWPVVRFVYAPGYVAWHSPWRWRHYPRWWKPWRPFKYHVFSGRCVTYEVGFHRVPARRVVVAHKIYTPRRNHSTLVVHNNRKTTVIRKNKKGSTKVIRVKRKRPRKDRN